MIVRSSADIKNEEDIMISRALPTIATGVDTVEEKETHLQQALLTSILGQDRSKTIDIPIPVVSELPPEQQLKLVPFKNPSSYIKLDLTDAEFLAMSVDYEADAQDEAWLNQQSGIDIDTFECAIDKLEKVQGFRPELIPYAGSNAQEALRMLDSEPKRKQVFNYWLAKRQSREGSRPLLRHFQPPPDPDDPNPAVAFRPVQKDQTANRNRARSNTYENYRKVLLLYQDLVKVRGVLDEIAKRERIKRDLFMKRIEYARKLSELAITNPRFCISLPDAEEQSLRRRQRRCCWRLCGRGGGERTGHTAARKKRLVSTGVDAFGFDDAAQHFLPQMRYFAGGFAVNGVACYDHRVFSAATLARSRPFAAPTNQFDANGLHTYEFPSASMRWAKPIRAADVDVAHRPEPRFRNAPGRGKWSASALDGQEDAWLSPDSARAAAALVGAPVAPARKRSTIVRPRLGRGGRIILDRIATDEHTGARTDASSDRGAFRGPLSHHDAHPFFLLRPLKGYGLLVRQSPVPAEGAWAWPTRHQGADGAEKDDSVSSVESRDDFVLVTSAFEDRERLRETMPWYVSDDSPLLEILREE
ncbi:Enhancer of polycomb-like 1 [Porphyridium purpureum]|uniref:Enhancer of polycomb-like protein n=1 Tax=Porphyridium purpureum TaxID=35688 RepID=A0A5J4YLI9_PORPP|nr:Enhancer of polycomb-like 1 [Porphyridium purpureum]|eukprot:POR5022..scf291_13